MSLLVTGSIGIDTVETPDRRADNVLGGSATYFAYAASLIHPVRLVGVVGDDFPSSHVDLFRERDIDLAGLEIRSGAKTFSWHGRYFDDMNQRESIRTDLNVVADAPPTIPESFRDSRYVFLANTHPAVQFQFIGQLATPALVVCDTMDLWINDFRDDLLQTLAAVDGIILNDSEARMISGHGDLLKAGRAVLDLGPKFVVVKKGEHGAMLLTGNEVVVVPAYPTPEVTDPTGAGDSFAAGMMACIADADRTDLSTLKSALAYGTCTASITIEDFSMNALRRADRAALESRVERFKTMLRL